MLDKQRSVSNVRKRYEVTPDKKDGVENKAEPRKSSDSQRRLPDTQQSNAIVSGTQHGVLNRRVSHGVAHNT
jgi:hypothetical protein